MKIIFTVIGLLSMVALVSLGLIQTDIEVASEIAQYSIILLLTMVFLPGNTSRLLFVSICSWIVFRYIVWRITSLPVDSASILASIGAVTLLLAEMYGSLMMVLGLFVNAAPLDRKVEPLPDDENLYPTVDVYIPTYSEPLSVVLPTIMGAVELDYPKSKFKVYVLDDGYPRSLSMTDKAKAEELQLRAEDLKKACKENGATYLTRENNKHAKSGNLNEAMSNTNGELILVLDADHVPTSDLLRNTVGFFIGKENTAFVQTPHFFLNADPVEKNLKLFNKIPAENDMFYRVVQKGLDLWNTSFFCGSAAVIRRKAIEDVGGFSHDSITEDASTSIKMHQKGWDSAYLGIPMVAGLQPETFASFMVQRLRWAMGMAQIMIKQNPFFVKGLSISQRLSYGSVVLFWLFPLARIVFFLSPLFSIFGNLVIYPTGLDYFYAYTVPYLIAIFLSTEKIFGRVRQFMTSEMYETIQSFYIFPALISTILKPDAPTFKVTPKGERLDHEFISELRKPFYVFSAITFIGFVVGGYRFMQEPESQYPMLLSLAWLGFNTILLMAAMGTLFERVQRRDRPRIQINEISKVKIADNQISCEIIDINEVGAYLKINSQFKEDELVLMLNDAEILCKIKSRSNTPGSVNVGVEFEGLSIETQRMIVKKAYGSSKRWMDLWVNREASINVPLNTIKFSMAAISSAKDHIVHGFKK